MPKQTTHIRRSKYGKPFRAGSKIKINEELNIKIIEAKARKIMIINNKIWDRHEWESGGDVVKSIYRNELKDELEKLNIRELSILYYYIFEDANYHTLNQALEELGIYKGTYGSEKAEQMWQKYRTKGGRTWRLSG